jgi:hypothetical protein
LDDAIDRGAEDDDLRATNGLRQLEEAFVDGPDGEGVVEACLSPADAAHAGGQTAPPGGQADGPADESDANNRQEVDSHQRAAVLRVVGMLEL